MPSKGLINFMNSLTNSDLTLSQQLNIQSDVFSILIKCSFGILAVLLVAYVLIRLAQKTNLTEK